jgi:hypothetical protein
MRGPTEEDVKKRDMAQKPGKKRERSMPLPR